MGSRKKKPIPYSNDLRYNTSPILSITLGLFLFLLFFQPLDPVHSEFNTKLTIIAAFAGITVILLFLFRVIIPTAFSKLFHPKKWNLLRVIIISFLFVACNSVAYAFFARYVGKIEITFLVAIKIVLLSVVPVAVYLIISQYKYLKTHMQNLIDLRPNRPLENIANQMVNFESDNKSEYLKVAPEDLIHVKSANNYIEVTYLSKGVITKKLIRSTLKSAEAKLDDFTFFVRCHRVCVVNIQHVTELVKAHDGYKLKINHVTEEVPVSRQYILKVREALKR